MTNKIINIQKKINSGASPQKAFVEHTLKEVYQKKSSFWKKMRKEKVLDLFHLCAKQVSAYRDFLQKARIHPDKIKTFEDFQTVLPVNKDNYLRSYPLEKLCVADSLSLCNILFRPLATTCRAHNNFFRAVVVSLLSVSCIYFNIRFYWHTFLFP